MKTKTLLTYGAIAAGAYLAYKMLFKKKTDANFANANGGLLSSTFSTSVSGSAGGIIAPSVPIWVLSYVSQNKVPSYIWKSCWNKVQLYVAQKYRFELKKVSQKEQLNMFMTCIAQKKLEMQNQMNLGSSSIRNTATM